jgi:protein TIF31
VPAPLTPEPYTELAARQSVHRLVELITPHGTSLHQPLNPIALSPGATIFESVRDGTASEPTFQEVEVALSNRKNKGKKEVVKVKKEAEHAFADWTSESVAPSFSKLPFSQDMPEAAPCLRSVQISPFNPPPPHLRQKGHQLYLQVATLEGETLTIVCTSRGWYVSRSNVNTFDPTPRTDGPITHSLVDLLHSVSPQFSERVSKLHPLSAEPLALEPISTVPIPQAEPAYPFLANLPKTAALADPIRAQLAYLHTGALTAEALDGARDWNEEIQGIKELPRSSMQERVLREKMAQKTWAEYTATSVRCVLAVARGDIPPLNPNEDPRAHMFLASNIFITKAVDSIDAYSHIGGDAAAHVSHGKDAEGVRILNKLDVEGVHLLGHTVVDWAGERWVCQSMLPGIFARRAADDEPAAETEADKKEDWVEVSPSKSTKSDAKADIAEDSAETAEEPTENPLIIYGADSESVNSMHWDAATHKIMSKIATAQRLAAHEVKDDKGKSYEFYASSEVKGLRGTDGRRYFLDLPRLSPVDVEWLEKDTEGKAVGSDEDAGAYPHRVVLLRPELVETFWESELKRWAREIAAKKAKDTEAAKAVDEEKPGESSATKQDAAEPSADALDDSQATPAASAAAAQRAEADAPLDANIDSSSLAAFNLRLNPDAFVDQAPTAKDTGVAYVPSKVTDESDPTIKAVRDASVFLRQVAIPAFVLDTLTGNTSGLMDGASLSRQLHGRGINIRYLGHLASTIDSFSSGADGEKRESGHLTALKGIVVQEMVVRAAKHVLRPLLVGLASEHASAAISHFLNCLLGTGFNPTPSALYDSFDLGGDDAAPAYTQLTPESLRESLTREIKSRFRFALPSDYLETGLKKKQLLREVAMRLGIQLAQQDYAFDKAEADALNSEDDREKTAPAKEKKDKKNKKRDAPAAVRKHTFEPSDVLALVPIVRSTAPSASVAEEIFDAGRATINRGSVDLGMEFLLEAVQLYENIHSVIHPEVAFAYNQYASTIHQLARIKIQQMASENGDPEQPLGLDVATAVRLQRQAVIIAERTLGVYHAETCNYYFNLAMLENLEGNAQASLRYFRHVLNLWDVIHGPGHTEINTVLVSFRVARFDSA